MLRDLQFKLPSGKVFYFHPTCNDLRRCWNSSTSSDEDWNELLEAIKNPKPEMLSNVAATLYNVDDEEDEMPLIYRFSLPSEGVEWRGNVCTSAEEQFDDNVEISSPEEMGDREIFIKWYNALNEAMTMDSFYMSMRTVSAAGVERIKPLAERFKMTAVHLNDKIGLFYHEKLPFMHYRSFYDKLLGLAEWEPQQGDGKLVRLLLGSPELTKLYTEERTKYGIQSAD